MFQKKHSASFSKLSLSKQIHSKLGFFSTKIQNSTSNSQIRARHAQDLVHAVEVHIHAAARSAVEVVVAVHPDRRLIKAHRAQTLNKTNARINPLKTHSLFMSNRNLLHI